MGCRHGRGGSLAERSPCPLCGRKSIYIRWLADNVHITCTSCKLNKAIKAAHWSGVDCEIEYIKQDAPGPLKETGARTGRGGHVTPLYHPLKKSWRFGANIP